MTKYAGCSNKDLLRAYERLERAMLTCDDGDEYVRCMAALDEMASEIQDRGLDMPETDYERTCSYLERGDHA